MSMVAAIVAAIAEERERCAKLCEDHAAEREAWIKTQNGFYLQYEDQGHTMTGVRKARELAEMIRGER